MTAGLSIERIVAACLAVALYVLLCAAIAYRQRRRHQQATRDAAALTPAAAGAANWLIAHASQTGNAEQLAWQTARMLHTAGMPARIVSLAQLQAEDLRDTERALFIASTYGEGDPPDSASAFARNLMAGTVPLPQLHYGLMALGDLEYKNFCGFGRTLDRWLQAQGARVLFPRVEVNNNDQSALHEWQHHLSHIAGTSDAPDWQAPEYQRWQLVARNHLNPGSAGNPCFHIELVTEAGTALPHWESGDLLQMLPPADRQRPREYSIASTPADGRVHLLVRQERHSDGTLGIASGWLTQQANIGNLIELRLRAHGNFHLGDNAARPLILIGNGTGLAGLRGHLKTRAALRQHRNWLIFGERNSAYDFYYREELLAWQQQGVLERADWVFSRDQPQREYVQDRLKTCADAVRKWLVDGAAIYVCGSLEGMAGGVEAALTEIVGIKGVEQLIEAGRYRRDVY
jgi:sulfite reductase (NADPH) flavoprotein alpha-component